MNVLLRHAADADLEKCRRIYFAEMDWINERLGLNRDEQESMFRKLWDPAQAADGDATSAHEFLQPAGKASRTI